MKVLIIGCGKFGVRLAEYLTRKNHEIVVVDNDPETFHALGAEFTGRTICGVGYDKAVLEQAGVASADVLIGCTSSDSLNAVVANIAKNVFHVPTVIARMYDPIRARMFESMGIYTVSITRLGLDNVVEYLEGKRSWRVIRKLGDGAQLVKIRVPNSLVGTGLASLNIAGKIRTVALERQGISMLAEEDARCEYNDILYLAISADSMTLARDMLQL